MARDLISKKTRNEFRELLVGWTLRDIELEFDAEDIPCSREYEPPVQGQRRSFVEQYYKSIDFGDPESVRRLLRVYENILADLEEVAQQDANPYAEGARQKLASLSRCLRKDGFVYKAGRLFAVGPSMPALQLKAVATDFDAPYLIEQIERMNEAVDRDPRLAVGTAKELVETTCKTILDELGMETRKSDDLFDLVKAVMKQLQLTPDDIPDAAKASDTIKRLLSNLSTIVRGMAELRNAYGSGHGPHARAKGLQPRHARLVAGAAATLATFLFETYQARSHS